MSSIAASSSGSSSAGALATNSATVEVTRKYKTEGSISGGLSFAGLGSGTDFQAMIDQLKKIEEIPKNRLQLWRADWQKRVDAFDELIDGITDISKQFSTMDKLSNFLTKVVSSTKSSAVNATATADAPVGSYKINVVQLASNGMVTTQKAVGTEKKDVIAQGGDFVFAYDYGDKTRELRVPEGTSLESFVNIVNNDTRNPGVVASLIKSGDGYIFQIQGKEPGTEHDLKINAATTLPAFTSDDGNWFTRPAEDALFYLEGRTEQILSSSSNQLTEVIPGMTITLTDTTDVVARDENGKIKWTNDDPPRLEEIKSSEPVMLTITNDTTSAKEKVQDFVDGINELIVKFQELTKWDSSKTVEDINKSNSQFAAQKGSVLTGNYGVQLLYSEMRSIMVGKSQGFNPLNQDGTGDVFWSLATIGISVDADESSKTFGQLVIKEGESEEDSPYRTLDEALEHDAEAVARVLSSDKVVRSDSPDFSYVGMLKKDMVTGGNHSVKYTVEPGDDTTVPPTAPQVSQVLIDGKPATYDSEANEWTSTADGSKGLVIRIDNLDPGEHKGSFSVQQGKINELNEFFTKQLKGANLEVGKQTDEKGSLHVLKENYLNIIDNIDKKIEREETRIALWESRQRRMYARLDALLSTYNQQMTANESALASASKNWSGSK